MSLRARATTLNKFMSYTQTTDKLCFHFVEACDVCLSRTAERCPLFDEKLLSAILSARVATADSSSI